MAVERAVRCGPIVIGPSLRLRLLGADDAPELHAAIAANRDYLARWLPWAAGQTLADTAEFIRGAGEQLAGNDGFQTAILDGTQIVGMIGFRSVEWEHRSTSIGYWLSQNRQGRGTMTAAVGALVDHALRIWRLNRVEIRAAVENRRSRAIPERLGFSEEGTLRQAERINDEYLDSVLYAMLAADWSANRRRQACSPTGRDRGENQPGAG